MTRDDLQRLSQEIMEDQELLAKFEDIDDRDVFIKMVLEAGKKKGYDVTVEEVHAAIEATDDWQEADELTDEQLDMVAGGMDSLFGRRTLRCDGAPVRSVPPTP